MSKNELKDKIKVKPKSKEEEEKENKKNSQSNKIVPEGPFSAEEMLLDKELKRLDREGR